MWRRRGYNAWRDLRARRHLTLRWAILDVAGMLTEHHGGRRIVWLDVRLDRPQRHATLCHELIHDERDILYHPSTPQPLVQVEEREVEREVARRLVPADLLAELASQRLSLGERLEVWEVAEAFDVPHPVAELAMCRMRHPDGASLGVGAFA